MFCLKSTVFVCKSWFSSAVFLFLCGFFSLKMCSFLCFLEHSLHREAEVVSQPSEHPLHPVLWGRKSEAFADIWMVPFWFSLYSIHLSKEADTGGLSTEISVSPGSCQLSVKCFSGEWYRFGQKLVNPSQVLRGHEIWSWSFPWPRWFFFSINLEKTIYFL